MAQFEINGKKYEAAKFSYNTSCLLEEYGVSIGDIAKKPQSIVRAYFAISSGLDLEDAGNEIEAHVKNGGDLGAVMSALADEMEKSDFFASLAGRDSSRKKK